MAKYTIHNRIFDFVVRIINLTKVLPKTVQNLNLISQVSRSATSMGANGQEADGATSKKQFIDSFTIVKKETKETNYWLEGQEIEAIISKILINSSK